MKHPGWYAWVALVVATVASIGLNAVVSINLAQRAVASEQESRARASEEIRRATCDAVLAQIEVYRETPPATAVGRNAARAWKDLGVKYQCLTQGGN